jgi:hypothetical protein
MKISKSDMQVLTSFANPKAHGRPNSGSLDVEGDFHYSTPTHGRKLKYHHRALLAEWDNGVLYLRPVMFPAGLTKREVTKAHAFQAELEKLTPPEVFGGLTEYY